MPQRSLSNSSSTSTHVQLPASLNTAVPVPSKTRVRRQPPSRPTTGVTAPGQSFGHTQHEPFSVPAPAPETLYQRMAPDNPHALVTNVKQAVDIWQGLTVSVPESIAQAAANAGPQPGVPDLTTGLTPEEEVAVRDGEEIRRILRQYRYEQAQQQKQDESVNSGGVGNDGAGARATAPAKRPRHGHGPPGRSPPQARSHSSHHAASGAAALADGSRKDLFDETQWENRTLAEMVRTVLLERVKRDLAQDAWVFECA